MIEFVLILAFIVAARRLRRAASAPRSIRIDVYHHFTPGPGERAGEPEPTGEIIRLTPKCRPPLRIVT